MSTFPNFGPLLTYAESVKSTTAIRRGIINQPTPEQYRNMAKVYQEVYAPICAKFGKLPVSSFFRSAALNRAIGGATNSAHLYGCAIDIDCDGIGYPTNKELFAWVRANLTFDQLIGEGIGADGHFQWVHIGLAQQGKGSRQQCLIMERKGGKTIYQAI